MPLFGPPTAIVNFISDEQISVITPIMVSDYVLGLVSDVVSVSQLSQGISDQISAFLSDQVGVTVT